MKLKNDKNPETRAFLLSPKLDREFSPKITREFSPNLDRETSRAPVKLSMTSSPTSNKIIVDADAPAVPATLPTVISRPPVITVPSTLQPSHPADLPSPTQLDHFRPFRPFSVTRASSGGSTFNFSTNSPETQPTNEPRLTAKLPIHNILPNYYKDDPKLQNLITKLNPNHKEKENTITTTINQTLIETRNAQDHQELQEYLSELNHEKLIIEGKTYSFEYFPKKIGNLPDHPRSTLELNDYHDPPINSIEDLNWKNELETWTKRHKDYLSHLTQLS